MTSPQPQQSQAVFQQRTFVAQALDPIHIGTGEFRLGRVDNTIVREPGTNLPKIPGSSIAGVTRAYAAMKTQRYPDCAGKGGESGDKHCCRCEVCVAFGFSSKQRGSFQGLAQFSDARLLFFPVYSLIGPRWISSPSAMESAGCSNLDKKSWDKWNSLLDSKAIVFGNTGLSQINLGWLYLPVYNPSSMLPGNWPSEGLAAISNLKPVFDNLVLVNDSLFSQIVNDQLEVRTSVSISPKTGAAEEGALFTAEALPRSTVLLFQVTALNPSNFTLPNSLNNGRLAQDLNAIHATVWKGLDLVEFLGIGGVNTRGMGRLKVFPEVHKTDA